MDKGVPASPSLSRPSGAEPVPVSGKAGIANADWIATVGVLAEAVHDRLFCIASLNDPALALLEISDGGGIHEAVHALIRALPPRPLTLDDVERQAASLQALLPAGGMKISEWISARMQDAASAAGSVETEGLDPKDARAARSEAEGDAQPPPRKV